MPLLALAAPIIGKALEGASGDKKKEDKEEGPGKLMEMFASVLGMGGKGGGSGEGLGGVLSMLA